MRLKYSMAKLSGEHLKEVTNTGYRFGVFAATQAASRVLAAYFQWTVSSSGAISATSDRARGTMSWKNVFTPREAKISGMPLFMSGESTV